MRKTGNQSIAAFSSASHKTDTKSTYNEVHSMLKGLFSNGNYGEDREEEQSISPRKPSELDFIYTKANQSIMETKTTQPHTDYQDSEHLSQFEQILDNKDSVVTNLKEQNLILKDQLFDLNRQLDELGEKLRHQDLQKKIDIQNAKCDHEPMILQMESILKIKDKEYNNVLQIQSHQNSVKDKEVQSLFAKLKALRAQIDSNKVKSFHSKTNTVGYDKINELESKLKEVERKHSELQAEANSLHRIQNEQSKALESIGNHKNYHGKVRDLINEMRDMRDKNKLLEENIRQHEETRKKNFTRMLTLEDKCKELKVKITGQNGDQEVDQPSQRQKQMDDNKLNLVRKVQLLERQIQDKERQNKMYAQKIRENQKYRPE